MNVTVDTDAPPDSRELKTGEPPRVELLLPMRTVLLVAATAGVLAAFVAIGETFLIVFIGIFLALVFEYPVRYVMAKTGMSRGLAAAATVLGTALAVLVIALTRSGGGAERFDRRIRCKAPRLLPE